MEKYRILVDVYSTSNIAYDVKIVKDPNGDFCKASDVEALEERNKLLQEVNKELLNYIAELEGKIEKLK